MFTLKVATEPSKLDELIDPLIKKMTNVQPGTAEYTEMAAQLIQLYKAQEIETNAKAKTLENRRLVNPDTVALIVANLAGILLIIGHERINIVTSKALGFVSKLK